MIDMPPKSKLKLPPLEMNDEPIGQRLARLRKERGLSQIALAEKMGIIQQLITDYEREKLRMHAEMVIRFAQALEVSTDELLGVAAIKHPQGQVSLKLAKRIQKIERLPGTKQKLLLHTIDVFLRDADQQRQAN
jgi:transcriptional regulator with XRE-family HTH domain